VAALPAGPACTFAVVTHDHGDEMGSVRASRQLTAPPTCEGLGLAHRRLDCMVTASATFAPAQPAAQGYLASNARQFSVGTKGSRAESTGVKISRTRVGWLRLQMAMSVGASVS
jgi:hypothetical protein